jgi:hypothetical protein
MNAKKERGKGMKQLLDDLFVDYDKHIDHPGPPFKTGRYFATYDADGMFKGYRTEDDLAYLVYADKKFKPTDWDRIIGGAPNIA